MRRATLTVFISALVVSSALAQSDRYTFPPDKRLVLPATSGAALLKQCSRAAPEGAEGYWVPTSAQLDKLESSLAVYLASRGFEISPPSGSYHRQYIGFTKGGRRFVYGNFYPGREKVSESERVEAVVVCDGGPSLWGVVYDIEKDAFSSLEFNGIA